MLSELRIEANKRCNFACDHCYTDKRGKVAPLEVLVDAIAQAKALGATNLSITGGEPLIDPDRTLALVGEGSRLGMRTRLNTNGWYADRSMLQKLQAAGLSEIQVSMSHSDPADFDRFVHRRGAFERATGAIREAAQQGIDTTVRCTLMNGNVHQLCSLYELASDLGATGFKVRALVEVNGVGEAGDQLTEIRSGAVDALKGRAQQRGVPVSIADEGEFNIEPSSTFDRLECKCGELAAFVTAEGVVTPCPFLREDSRFWFGDITDQPLGQILKSQGYREFVGDRTVDACGNDAACACKANRVSVSGQHTPNSRHLRLQ